MFVYMILLFTLLPAIELAILIKVGSHIGAINTMMIIIITGVTGAYLARFQGFLVLNKIQTSLNQGIMPSSELMDGLMILVGGILLLTPGFVTDILGIFLLIPLTRSLIKYLLRNKFESMLKNGQAIRVSPFNNYNKEYNDIDIN